MADTAAMLEEQAPSVAGSGATEKPVTIPLGIHIGDLQRSNVIKEEVTALTHLYNQPIAVTLTGGKPATIRWRDVTYRVAQVNEPWHLTDCWWHSDATGARSSGRSRGDRTYYRVQCVSAARDDLTCDIYFEAVIRGWVLERVYD